jgi:hypothetical protein
MQKNNVNVPQTMGKLSEGAGPDGSADFSKLLVDSQMDMTMVDEAHQNMAQIRRDGGPGELRDPESKKDSESASTAGGAVGKDPEAKHDGGAAYETGPGFKGGWGGNS